MPFMKQPWKIDDTVKFVNLGLLRGSVDGTIVNYGGFELIKIAVEDRRLKVERGYSPDVVLERSTGGSQYSFLSRSRQG